MTEEIVTTGERELLELFIGKIAHEVEEELNDPEFPAHWHGRPIGTNNRCRGPLCKWGHRERMRRKNNRGPDNPYLDAYLEMCLVRHNNELREKARKDRKSAS